MQSNRRMSLAPIKFNDVKAVEEMLLTLVRMNILQRLDEADHYGYGLVGRMADLYSQFIVDIKGNTYFKPEIEAAVNTRRLGLLPSTPIYTLDTTAVKMEDYKNHLSNLVHNEVLAEMLLSAKFVEVPNPEAKKNVTNELSYILRPTCKKTAEIEKQSEYVLFPAGFKLETVMERMKYFMEPANYAAQSLIEVYYKALFTHLDNLYSQREELVGEVGVLLEQNILELEQKKIELIQTMNHLIDTLNQEKNAFVAMMNQKTDKAFRNHPAQAYNMLEKLCTKRNVAKQEMKNCISMVFFPILAPVSLPWAFWEQKKKNEYTRIRDYRTIAEKNGGILPEHRAKKVTPEVSALFNSDTFQRKKINYWKSVRNTLDVNNAIDPNDVLNGIDSRIAELRAHVAYLEDRANFAPQTANTETSAVALATYGFDYANSSSSSSSSSSRAPEPDVSNLDMYRGPKH